MAYKKYYLYKEQVSLDNGVTMYNKTNGTFCNVNGTLYGIE